MRPSLPSVALGLLIGLLVWPVVVEQALTHLFTGDRLVLTQDLVLCPEKEKQLPCAGSEGGLLAGTAVQLDSKGFATVTFRVLPPLVTGAYVVAPDEKVGGLVLSKRSSVPPR